MKKKSYKKGIRLITVLAAFMLMAGCVQEIPGAASSSKPVSSSTGREREEERSRSQENSTAGKTDSDAKETSKSDEAAKPADPEIVFYHSEMQINDQVAAELKRGSVEIVKSKFTYYEDAYGKKHYHFLIEYKNNGSEMVFTPGVTLRLYDGNGQKLVDSGFSEVVYGVMRPGETDYAFYDGHLDDKYENGAFVPLNIDLKKGVVPAIEWINVQSWNPSDFTFYECETDIVMDITEEGLMRFTGTITNPTDTDLSMVRVSYLLFDANDEVIGIASMAATLLHAKETKEMLPTALWNQEIKPEQVAYFKTNATTWKI